MRTWLVCVVVALLVAGCCPSTPAPISPSSAQGGTSTTRVRTSATPAATTTSAAAPTTADNRVLVLAGPPDGMYFHQQPIEPIWGDVHPEAVVTVNGLPTDVAYIGDTVHGSSMWRWSTYDDIPLQVEKNALVVEATFPDDSTLRDEHTVHYDPTLERATGYILALTLAIPPSATIEIAQLEYGEHGVEQTSVDTTIAQIPIAQGAVFDVLEDDMLDLKGFSQLAATAAHEEPLDLWWDIIFPPTIQDRAHKAAPWEFFLTPGGELQQASQLYSP